jgi:hypothetical protein
VRTSLSRGSGERGVEREPSSKGPHFWHWPSQLSSGVALRSGSISEGNSEIPLSKLPPPEPQPKGCVRGLEGRRSRVRGFVGGGEGEHGAIATLEATDPGGGCCRCRGHAQLMLQAGELVIGGKGKLRLGKKRDGRACRSPPWFKLFGTFAERKRRCFSVPFTSFLLLA